MEECTQCHREFPDHLINQMVMGGGYAFVCPLCALEMRNKAHGIPVGTPFRGEMAHDMWLEATEYVAQQGG